MAPRKHLPTSTTTVPAALVTVSGEISLGQLIQVLTVATSIIGAVFAAGGYVQGLRDDIATAVHSRAAGGERVGDDRSGGERTGAGSPPVRVPGLWS